ncbi:hypothetical protein [Ureibacillus sinduriensis]|uniref:WxL domain-containing protein n=1 Tax=Ureibacillus sinduriensis BLB-1 = JCM 15800 TaxID=1384057 RepID=A0A0A3HXV7_9BACL|nr:hypothetical protein [Ureibacillus sinduriensis]KGR76070.1 hypothetical protein CD33_07775 [Ureibacillus sinduriensis BLB-1 = JCM 15800]
MKNFIKVLSFLSVFFVFAVLSTEKGFAASDDSQTSVSAVKVTITNDLTGEQTVITPEEVSSESNGDTLIKGYEVLIPLEEEKSSGLIQPMDSGGGTKTSNGVKAELYVDYTVNAAKEEIKLNRVWGKWTPTASYYYLSNRTVDAHSGSIWGSVLSKTPTSNSFDYTTGFGYNYFAGGQASPRAWSSAKVHISGMTATSTINLEITYP